VPVLICVDAACDQAFFDVADNLAALALLGSLSAWRYGG
jgi:hypothetical protein